VRPSAGPSPPSYRANAIVRKTFRFINSGGSATEQTFNISSAKLCALIAFTNVVNTTLSQLFETVKIKYVELWQGPNTNSLLPRTVSVQYNGGNLGTTGSDQPVSDMSVGATRVAHVKVKPRKGIDQAGFFQPGQTNVGVVQLFAIVCSLGAVIDVCGDFVMSSDARTTNNTLNVVTAAAGTYYYMALDNTAGATLSSANFLTPDPTLVTTI
jgi:hypothetical protein